MSNIIIYKGKESGETQTIGVTINDESVTPSIPYDITGFTLYLTVKKKKSDLDVDALISKTQTIHDDPVNGQSHFDILADDTKDMEYNDYVYDVEIRNADETIIRTVLVGHMEVQERVKD